MNRNDDEPLQVVAVAALIFRDGRLLCMRRSAWRDAGPGLWEAVSGRVRRGEQPLAAAHREVREESGLVVDFDPRPVTAYQAKRRELPMTVVVYRARVTGGDVRMSDEHDDYAWLTPDEFAQRSTLTLLVDASRAAAGVPWPAAGGVALPASAG